MQAQYSQYTTMPPQHGAVGAPANQFQGYSSLPPTQQQIQEPGPFAHLLQLPIFQVYSLNEFAILQKTIREKLKNKQLRQEILDDLPPPPSTADAMTAKVVMEYLSIMSDGGMTFVANRFNLNKLMSGTMNLLDAMDNQEDPCSTVVYTRWASPVDMPGAPIIVDILGWYKINKRSQMSGVMVKTNTEAKFRINSEKAVSLKEGKSWSKTWFRGREDHLNVVVTNGAGVEVTLEKILAVERTLSTPIYGDFLGRWKEHKVPRV